MSAFLPYRCPKGFTEMARHWPVLPLKIGVFGIKLTSSHATHDIHSSCKLSSGPCPRASLSFSFSRSLCLADIKLLGAVAASPIWEVSAGKITNIWTARSASNNAAFVPLPYSLLTSQLLRVSRPGSRSLHWDEAQQGGKRPLTNVYMLQLFAKHHLVLNHTLAHMHLGN